MHFLSENHEERPLGEVGGTRERERERERGRGMAGRIIFINA